MDDYAAETPEEREAGRQMMTELERVGIAILKYIRGEMTREEVEKTMLEVKNAG